MKTRLMLTIYVESLEDAQRTFNALEWLKQKSTSYPKVIPSLDWDLEWDEVKENETEGL